MNDNISARTWILIWSIIFGAIGVFLWMVINGAMGDLSERFYRLEVPGSMEIPRLARGHYFVYHEFDKSRDSKEDIRPAGFQRMVFTIRPAEGGDPLPLRPVEKTSRFVIRRNVCESILEFDVPKSGGYRVNGEYDATQEGGTYRIAIGQPYYLQAVRSFIAGLGLLVVAGILVTYLLFRGMRNAPPLPAPPSEEAPSA